MNKIAEILISILTFVTHVILGSYIILLGNILIHPFFGATPAFGDVIKGYGIICIGLVILITGILPLIWKSFTVYALSIVTVVITTIGWIFFIASYDALLFLIMYLAVFTPFVVYKYFRTRVKGN